MMFQLTGPLYKDQLFYVLYEETYINEKLDYENVRQSICQREVNSSKVNVIASLRISYPDSSSTILEKKKAFATFLREEFNWSHRIT